jgi:secreted trypsin-like serine protease
MRTSAAAHASPRLLRSGAIFLLCCAATSWAGEVVRPRIIDGTNVPASQFPTVGQVGDELYGSLSFYCSGTLIGSRYVMTAAHCVCDEDGVLLVPPTLGRFKLGGTVYKTKNIHVHPSYRGDYSFLREGDFDLAILELDTDVQGVTPTQIYRSTPVVGQLLTLAGYGLVGDGEFGVTDASQIPPDGTIEFGTTPIDQVSATFVRWLFEEKAPPNKEANTSPGDSGGPAFLDDGGTLKLAAVTSGGTNFFASFGDFSFDTRVDAQAPWIDTILAGKSSNDQFANAKNLRGAPASDKASNVGASREAGEPLHGGDAGGASLWWRWTAPVNGMTTVSTADSAIATKIGVYTGGAVNYLNVVSSNGNTVTFMAQGAKTYFIAVDGAGGATGAIDLKLTEAGLSDIQIESIEIFPEVALPGDDVFYVISLYNAGTQDVYCPVSFWTDLDQPPTLDTFPEGVGYADLPAGGKDFIYFVATATGSKEARTARAYADAYLGISSFPETDETNNIAEADWRVVSSLPNDDYVNAIALPSGDSFISGTNVGATREVGEPLHANRPGGNSVWYKWKANASGLVSLGTDGSTFDTVIGVYTGNAVDQLTEVGSNDDAFGDTAATLDFLAVAGTTYYIAIDGVNEDQSGTFFLDLFAPSSDDLFVRRLRMKFDFAKTGRDSLSLQGVIDLPFDFENPALVPVTVVVGDFVQEYQLDGKGRSADKQFRIAANFRDFTGKVQLNVKKADLFASLSKLGFTNADVDSTIVLVPVIVAIGEESFQALVPVTYKAKKDRSGSAKN